MNSAFDNYAKVEQAVIAVFPNIVTERAFIGFLNELGSLPRWKLRRRSATSPTAGALIGLEWTTSSGDVSNTMGFAPFASMPVSRRGPYVAIAVWPGARSNEFRGQPPTPPSKPGEVGFLDAAHRLEETEYRTTYEKTTVDVASLMAIPPDNAKLYRDVAFVILAEHADKLDISDA